MQEVNWTALIIFMLLFGFITWLGFAAAHWRKGDLDQLHEWGLGGRRFGTIVTWFLVGGDLYTAYTFIAVPALAFGAGAIAFFAVPYTIMIYPILFLVFPRLWYVCHKHGYITAGRFRARPLRQSLAGAGGRHHRHRRHHALYRAAAGRPAGGDRRHGRRRRLRHVAPDLPLIIAFVILAAFTYSSGLRAPASIAIVKDILIYITAFAAVIVIPIQLGGYGKIFAAVPPAKLLLAVPGANTTGAYGVYATLALGSALALFLYPHSMTGILQRSSGHAIRRNAAMLPGYSFMLGLLALVGFLAIAAGVGEHAGIRRGLQAVRQQFRGAGAVPAQLPGMVRRHRLRRHRHRRAGAGRDHVDRRGQPFHPQHPSRIHQQEPDRQGRGADGEMGVARRQVGRARLHHVRADPIRHPAAASGRHLDHPDRAGGAARRLYALVQRLGAADRLGRRHRDRDWMADAVNFAAELSASDRRP